MSQAILTNKRPILDSLGSKYHDLYYSEMSSSVSLIEATGNYQNTISIPSARFGSTSTINLPIDQFIGECILHLRLPTVVANQYLCRGWGYTILREISVILGASGTMNASITGDCILQTVLGQCTSNEKRSELLALAGLEVGAVPTAPGGGYVDFTDAFLLLPLPFSTACDKLPLDSTMLSNPIQIKLSFGSADSIYGGGGVKPAGFDVAEILVRQIKLTDQADSVRQMMIADPNLIYSYPWIYTQAFESGRFTGLRPVTDSGKCSVQLNQFLNADILGIWFWVIADKYKYPTGGNTPAPYWTDDISNINVTYNGTQLFNFPGKSYKLTGMMAGDQDSTQFAYPRIADGSAGPLGIVAHQSAIVFLDFARLRAACIHDHMYNTSRLTNQTLIVSFNTEFDANTSYTLYACYAYNALTEFSFGTSETNM